MRKLIFIILFNRFRHSNYYFGNNRLKTSLKMSNKYNYYQEYKTKNIETKIKYCKNCKHMMIFPCNDNDYGYKYSKCKKFINNDICKENLALSYTTNISTKSLFEYFDFSKDCRIDENKCGNDGKYYEYIE